MDKRIIDVCCGGKMFWFDKNNPDVEFCDKRTVERFEYYKGQYFEVSPDTVCDFTDLPFPDESFYLVVFDPPHIVKQANSTSIVQLKYGKLGDDWKETLSRGFAECMRVLKPNGVMVFKWSEVDIPLKQVLSLFPQQPLFGNRNIQKAKTHWLCFMKDGESDE